MANRSTDAIGAYEKRSFPAFRNATIDTLDLGKAKHHIPVLLEIDVTQARQYLRQLKADTGAGLSFTGWVIYCISQAISEHKSIQAMRQGKRQLILFEDVDVSVIIERAIAQEGQPTATLPMPYIIRQANRKTVNAIHHEIRTAQQSAIGAGAVQIRAQENTTLTRIFSWLPKFVRHLLLWRRLTRDPFFAKRAMGTVSVTAMGSGMRYNGYGWGIPIGIHPVIFALGSIAKKPGVVDDTIAIREYLSLTILFDHDVIDGAPVFRFAQRLNRLLEQGYGLVD